MTVSNALRRTELDNNMARWGGMSTANEELDRQNQQNTENLSHKITRLKSLALDIETETKDHNHLLDGVGSDFDSSESLLSGSANRLTKLMNRGRGDKRLMCYVTGAFIVVFFISYYLIFKVNR